MPAEPKACCICCGVEPQQVAHRGRGGQRAGGAGGVEHLVVRAAEELADADADLVAGDRGRQQLAAASAERLRHRQRRREHHRGRMEHRAVVHVVLLGEVRGRGVDHRREQRACVPRAVISTSDGPVGRPHRRAKRAIASTGRAPLPASAEPNQSSSRSSARRTHRRRDVARSAGRRRSAASVAVGMRSFMRRARRSDGVRRVQARDRRRRRSPARAGWRRCARRAPAPGPCAASKPLRHARRQQRRHRRRPACRPRPSARARCSCGCAHTSPMSFTRALAICAASSRCDHLLGVERRRTPRRSARAARRARRRAARWTSKRGSAASAGCRSTLLAEHHPLALVLQPEHHRPAVAGGERAVGIDRRVRGAGARRRRGAVDRRSTADSSSTRPCSRASTRRCGCRARSCPRCDQRREDAAVRVHAGGDVGDRAAGLGRLVGRAGDRQEARLALDQQVVGLLVAVRAPSGRRRSPRCRRRSAAGCARCSASYDRPRRAAAPGARFCTSTSARATALASTSAAPRMLEVERQAFLRAVGPDEVRGQAAHALVVAAREVADAGALDLDHARAEVGELARAERRRDRVLERDDGDAIERSCAHQNDRGRPSTCSAT